MQTISEITTRSTKRYGSRQRRQAHAIIEYNLVGITADYRHALVTRTPGGWTFPRMRPHLWRTSSERALALLSREATNAQIVHIAPLAPELSTPHVDAFAIIAIVSGPTRTQTTALVRTDELLTMRPLLASERQVLVETLDKLASPVATFDTMAEPLESMKWATDRLDALLGTQIIAIEHAACCRYKRVSRIHTTDGTVRFMAGPQNVLRERALTEALWTVCPRHVVRSIATDGNRRYWLAHEPRGERLDLPILSKAIAEGVARTLARVQMRALNAAAVHDELMHDDVDASGIFATINKAAEETLVNGPLNRALLAAWRYHASAIERACNQLDRMNLPKSIVIRKCHGKHVIVNGKNVAFINLSQCYWTYPFLSLWNLNRYTEQMLRTYGESRARLERAFVAEWSSIVTPRDMLKAMSYVPILGGLLEVLGLLNRVLQEGKDRGTPAPSWYVALRLGTVLRELVEAM